MRASTVDIAYACTHKYEHRIHPDEHPLPHAQAQAHPHAYPLPHAQARALARRARAIIVAAHRWIVRHSSRRPMRPLCIAAVPSTRMRTRYPHEPATLMRMRVHAHANTRAYYTYYTHAHLTYARLSHVQQTCGACVTYMHTIELRASNAPATRTRTSNTQLQRARAPATRTRTCNGHLQWAPAVRTCMERRCGAHATHNAMRGVHRA